MRAPNRSLPEDPRPRAVTGNFILRFDGARITETADLLQRAGLRVASADDSDSHALRADQAGDADVILLPRMGVALLSGEEESLARIESAHRLGKLDSPLVSIVAEELFALSPVEEPQEGVLEDVTAAEAAAGVAWHLAACGVPGSSRTGAGVSVAVLDTGLHFGHVDFVGRAVTSASFVFNVPTADDRHGHGTHTTGLVCGPAAPASGARYGVAPDVELFVGKVFSDGGVGTTGEIVSGIEWAVAHRCRVVLLALERPVAFGTHFNQSVFHELGATVLARGSLLVAAVGNDSHRPAPPAPVSEPANSPNVFGVGGAAPPAGLYDESNGERAFPGAGTVDVIAPAVSVFSSWLPPAQQKPLDGTSMAAAITSGIAALWAEVDATLIGARLGRALRLSARDLGFPVEDAGRGLVQAPP